MVLSFIRSTHLLECVLLFDCMHRVVVSTSNFVYKSGYEVGKGEVVQETPITI